MAENIYHDNLNTESPLLDSTGTPSVDAATNDIMGGVHAIMEKYFPGHTERLNQHKAEQKAEQKAKQEAEQKAQKAKQEAEQKAQKQFEDLKKNTESQIREEMGVPSVEEARSEAREILTPKPTAPLLSAQNAETETTSPKMPTIDITKFEGMPSYATDEVGAIKKVGYVDYNNVYSRNYSYIERKAAYYSGANAKDWNTFTKDWKAFGSSYQQTKQMQEYATYVTDAMLTNVTDEQFYGTMSQFVEGSRAAIAKKYDFSRKGDKGVGVTYAEGLEAMFDKEKSAQLAKKLDNVGYLNVDNILNHVARKDKGGHIYYDFNGGRIYGEQNARNAITPYVQEYNHSIRLTYDDAYRKRFIEQKFHKTEEEYLADLVDDNIQPLLNEYNQLLREYSWKNQKRDKAFEEQAKWSSNEYSPYFTTGTDEMQQRYDNLVANVQALKNPTAWNGVKANAFSALGNATPLGLMRSIESYISLNAAYKGKDLTLRDKMNLKEAQIMAAIEELAQVYCKDLSAADVAGGVVQSLAFMADMAIQSATLGGGAMAEVGVKEAFKQGGAKAALKEVGRGLIIGAKQEAVRTPLSSATWGDFFNRRASQFVVTEDGVEKHETNAFADFTKAYGYAWANRYSEHWGDLLGDVMSLGKGSVIRTLTENEIFGKVLDSRFGKGLQRLGDLRTVEVARNIRRGLHISNFGAEVASEFFGDVIAPVASGEVFYAMYDDGTLKSVEEHYSNVFSKDNALQTVYTCGILTGVGTTINAAGGMYNGVRISSLRNEVRKDINNISNVNLRDILYGEMNSPRPNFNKLASLNWKGVNVADATLATRAIFNSAKVQAMRGAEMEVKRLQTFMPVIAFSVNSAYRGVDMASPAPTTDVVEVHEKDAQGNATDKIKGYVIYGDLTNAKGIVQMMNFSGQVENISAQDVAFARKPLSDHLAEQYNLAFSDSIEKERLEEIMQNMEDRYNVDSEAREKMLQENGFSRYKVGDVVTLVSGQQATIKGNAKNGQYTAEVLSEDGKSTTMLVGFESILNEQNPTMAQAQVALFQEGKMDAPIILPTTKDGRVSLDNVSDPQVIADVLPSQVGGDAKAVEILDNEIARLKGEQAKMSQSKGLDAAMENDGQDIADRIEILESAKKIIAPEVQSKEEVVEERKRNQKRLDEMSTYEFSRDYRSRNMDTQVGRNALKRFVSNIDALIAKNKAAIEAHKKGVEKAKEQLDSALNNATSDAEVAAIREQNGLAYEEVAVAERSIADIEAENKLLEHRKAQYQQTIKDMGGNTDTKYQEGTIGADKRIFDFAKKASKVLGMDVKVDESAFTSSRQNGVHRVTEDGKSVIYINPNSTAAEQGVGILAHEIGHGFKKVLTPEGWAKFEGLVLTARFGKDWVNGEEYKNELSLIQKAERNMRMARVFGENWRELYTEIENGIESIKAEERKEFVMSILYAKELSKIDKIAHEERNGKIKELLDKYNSDMMSIYGEGWEDRVKRGKVDVDNINFISDAKAREEAVTYALQTFIFDGERGARAFEAIINQDLNWRDKLMEVFRNVVDKLKSLFNVEKPTEQDLAVQSAIEEFGNIFKRYAQKSGEIKAEQIEGETAAIINEKDGQSSFSLSTYEDGGRDILQSFLDSQVEGGKLEQKDANAILTEMDAIYDICMDYKDEYAPFGAWSDAAVVRDGEGMPVFSVIKANGDYAMNLDFSLVCKKRRTLDAVLNEMIGRKLIEIAPNDPTFIAKVNDVVRKYGFETACRLCFVDAKRFRVVSTARNFCKLYNGVVAKLMPTDKKVAINSFDAAGVGYPTHKGGLDTLADSELNIKALEDILKRNGEKTVIAKIARHLLEHPEDRKLVHISDFVSTRGFDPTKALNPQILSLYNSKKGSGGPKASFSDVQYLNDVIYADWNKEDAYAVGGVRVQSFSDYVPRMVFDYMQMVADLAAKQMPVHAYTKEAAFAKTFGLTGMKINMSLVPTVVEGGVAAGLDADGNYAWEEGETFDYDTAIEIQNADGYRENCGTIAVGVSDEHIDKMLDDDNIRMVIPYHKSGLNKAVAIANNIDAFKDYTNQQNTRYTDGTKLSSADSKNVPNFNEDTRRLGDPRKAADAYLAWCKENNYKPKFDKWASHPNYYKLLEDFTTLVDGEYFEQRGVTMTFPKEGDAFGSLSNLIAESLEEDAVLEGKRDSLVGAMVDEIESTLFSNREKALESSNSLQKQPNTQEVVSGADVAESYSISRNNEAVIDKWLGKREDFTDDIKSAFKEYIADFKPATQLATTKWFANGVIRIPEDMPKVEQAMEIAQRKKVDALQYNSPMELIDQFGDVFKPKAKLINPDDVPTLTNKVQVPNTDITIYDVEDSEESRVNFRNLMNTHFGKNANPWCLMQAEDGVLTKESADYWKNYNKFQRRAAFKGGKLIAFFANDDAENPVWWDRMDKPYNGIPITQKIEGDELGRSATYLVGEDGILDSENYTNIHKGNKQNGLYEMWHDINTKSYRATYKNGKIDGVETIYFSDGRNASVMPYTDGKRDGEYAIYYREGGMRANGTYKDNKHDGLAQSWHRNGNLEWRRTYDNGKLEGVGETFDENGNLTMREEYENGIPRIEEHYKDGKLNGWTTRWDKDGDIVSREYYVDGKRNKLQEFARKFTESFSIDRSQYLEGLEDDRAFASRQMDKIEENVKKNNPYGIALAIDDYDKFATDAEKKLSQGKMSAIDAKYAQENIKTYRAIANYGRAVLAEQFPDYAANAHANNLKSGKTNLAVIRGLFQEYNSDEHMAELFDLVSSVAEKFGTKFRLATLKGNLLGHQRGNLVEYNTATLNSGAISDQDKARIILHEMIHAATSQGVELCENARLREMLDVYPSTKLRTSVRRLKTLLEDIRNNEEFKGEYGTTNAHEMLAELSNPRFVEKLKKHDIWTRIVDGIREIASAIVNMVTGKDIAKSDAYTEVRTTLTEIIEETPMEFVEGLNRLRDAGRIKGVKPLVAESAEEIASIAESEGTTSFSLVRDEAKIAELDASPKRIGYRNVILNEDGTFSSPMAAYIGNTGKGKVKSATFTLGEWEEAEENPQLVDEKGQVVIYKDNGKPTRVAYDPYIHNRTNKVNSQFKEAWKRPNLVYVETEVPINDLESGYHADKAKLAVGTHDWAGGSGEVMLSRYDKPIRIVSWEEVADDWVARFKDRGVEFDIVPPALLPILKERGVEILPPHKGLGADATEAYEASRTEQESYSLSREDVGKERADIERKAKADGTWLKAPNGKDTNLTPEQWVTVRTKAFKEWFGDWEKVANIRSGIDALIQIAQGAESIPNAMRRDELTEFGGTAEITFDWGEYGKPDKSGTLRGGFGFAKIIQKHGYNEAFRIIETIANGEIGTPYGVENGKRVDIVNGEYHTTISLYRDGKSESWVLTGYKIDPNTDAKGRGNDLSKATQIYPTPTREDLGAALKSNANIQYFNEIQNISSKIVDENGEPKVVYHQTNGTVYINRETGENWDELDWQAKDAWDERDDWEEYWEEQDFYTFSRVNARTTNELDGFFFAPEYDEYHEYGKRTIPAFLNIRKPASSADYRVDATYNNAGRKERIRMQNEGYDGVVNVESDGRVWEYIAFEPNQIKSATENIGTFDLANDDIRYSLNLDDVTIATPEMEAEANEELELSEEQQLMMMYAASERRYQNYRKRVAEKRRNLRLKKNEVIDEVRKFLRDKSFREGAFNLTARQYFTAVKNILNTIKRLPENKTFKIEDVHAIVMNNLLSSRIAAADGALRKVGNDFKKVITKKREGKNTRNEATNTKVDETTRKIIGELCNILAPLFTHADGKGGKNLLWNEVASVGAFLSDATISDIETKMEELREKLENNNNAEDAGVLALLEMFVPMAEAARDLQDCISQQDSINAEIAEFEAAIKDIANDSEVREISEQIAQVDNLLSIYEARGKGYGDAWRTLRKMGYKSLADAKAKLESLKEQEFALRRDKVENIKGKIEGLKGELIGNKNAEVIAKNALISAVKNMNTAILSVDKQGRIALKGEIAKRKEAQQNFRKGVLRSMRDPLYENATHDEKHQEGVGTIKGAARKTAREWRGSRWFADFVDSFEMTAAMIDRMSIPNEWLNDGFYYQFILHPTNGVLARADWRYKTEKALRKQLDEKVAEIFADYKRGSIANVKDAIKKKRGTFGLEDLKSEFKKKSGVKAKTLLVNMKGEPVAKDAVAKEINFTIAQLLYIRAMVAQQGGINGYITNGLTTEQVKEIVAYTERTYPEFCKLDDWIRGADGILEQIYDIRNEEYKKTHNGRNLDFVEGYYPIKRKADETYNPVDLGDKIDMGTIAGGIGSNKKRVRNSTPIDISTDYFEVLDRHISESIQWAASAPIIDNMNTLLSNKAFKKILKAQGYNMQALKNMTLRAIGERLGDAEENQNIFTKAINYIAKSAVAAGIVFNSNSAIKQLVSLTAAFSQDVSPRLWLHFVKNCTPTIARSALELGKEAVNGGELLNALKDVKVWRGCHKWAMDNLPTYAERADGENMGYDIFDKDGIDTMERWFGWIKRYGMKANAAFDLLSCSLLAKSYYDYQYAVNIERGMSEAEADADAKMRAANIMNQTQQSSQGAYLSKMQADKLSAGAALLRMVAVSYQNSQIAMDRRSRISTNNLLTMARDLWGDRKGYERVIRYQTEQYVQRGMDEERAKERAENDYADSILSQVNNLFHNQILNGVLWVAAANMVPMVLAYISSAWGGDDDDESKEVTLESLKRITSKTLDNVWYNSLPMSASIARPIFEVAFGDESTANPQWNPLLQPLFAFRNEWKKYEKLIEEGGYDEDTKAQKEILGWVVVDALSRYGLGASYRTIKRMVDGVSGYIENGEIDNVLNVLNSPREATKLIVGRPRKGETMDQYTERVSGMYKIINGFNKVEDVTKLRKQYVDRMDEIMFYNTGFDYDQFKEDVKKIGHKVKRLAVDAEGELREGKSTPSAEEFWKQMILHSVWGINNDFESDLKDTQDWSEEGAKLRKKFYNRRKIVVDGFNRMWNMNATDENFLQFVRDFMEEQIYYGLSARNINQYGYEKYTEQQMREMAQTRAEDVVGKNRDKAIKNYNARLNEQNK